VIATKRRGIHLPLSALHAYVRANGLDGVRSARDRLGSTSWTEEGGCVVAVSCPALLLPTAESWGVRPQQIKRSPSKTSSYAIAVHFVGDEAASRGLLARGYGEALVLET
jgi:hypothetical protein